MSIVVDASVLVAALTDTGATGTWAESVLTEGDILTPQLALVESANILRKLERGRQLSPGEATVAHRDLLRLDLLLVPYEPFAQRIWDLRDNLTAYDAWYVAVAEAFDMPLATLDRRLSRAAGPACRFQLPA